MGTQLRQIWVATLARHPVTNIYYKTCLSLFWLEVLGFGQIRLLHPQYLDGIWIGQDQYRMPLTPLSEYPEAWF